MESSRAIEPGLYTRYLAMFLDGIRTDRSFQPLPSRALTAAETHRAMTRKRHPDGPQPPRRSQAGAGPAPE